MIKAFLSNKARALASASWFLCGFGLAVSSLLLGSVCLLMALVLDFLSFRLRYRGKGAEAPLSASKPDEGSR